MHESHYESPNSHVLPRIEKCNKGIMTYHRRRRPGRIACRGLNMSELCRRQTWSKYIERGYLHIPSLTSFLALSRYPPSVQTIVGRGRPKDAGYPGLTRSSSSAYLKRGCYSTITGNCRSRTRSRHSVNVYSIYCLTNASMTVDAGQFSSSAIVQEASWQKLVWLWPDELIRTRQY